MFADEFCNVLMQNEPKVEMPSDVPRKSSYIFENVRITFEQDSDNLRRSSVWKLLKMQQFAREEKSCAKGKKLLEL